MHFPKLLRHTNGRSSDIMNFNDQDRQCVVILRFAQDDRTDCESEKSLWSPGLGLNPHEFPHLHALHLTAILSADPRTRATGSPFAEPRHR